MPETFTFDEVHDLLREYPDDVLRRTHIRIHFNWRALLPFGSPINLRYSVHQDDDASAEASSGVAV